MFFRCVLIIYKFLGFRYNFEKNRDIILSEMRLSFSYLVEWGFKIELSCMIVNKVICCVYLNF